MINTVRKSATEGISIEAMEQPTATPTPTLLPTRVGSDACEPNGTLTLACLFGENQSQQFNFVPPFREGPDQDFYRIWVKPGVTITCETETTNSTRKITNRICAIPVAAPAIPPKPNSAAISATIRKNTAQPNIVIPSF